MIYKAQTVLSDGSDVVPDLEIVASEAFPRVTSARGVDWLSHHERLHEEAAEEIVSKLRGSLPGGTLDRVLVKLLQHAVSVRIVPDRGAQNEGQAK